MKSELFVNKIKFKSKNDNKQYSRNEATNRSSKTFNPITINDKNLSLTSLLYSSTVSINFSLKILQILFLFCFASFLVLTNCKGKKHYCGSDLLKTPKRILVPEEPLLYSSQPKRMQTGEAQTWESLRIHFDFSYIEQKVSEGIIKQKDLIDLRDHIMPKAKAVFEGLLDVKRIKNKLKLNSPHCETFPIPDIYNHAGDGVTADIVIFVLIDTSGFFNDNGIEAAAIHCLQHQETRRPISGYIQFKSDLEVNTQFSKDYYAWLAIHEISHILVINRALYEDYIDQETLAPLGYDRVIGSKVLENGSKMNFIKTPKVMEKAKEHFGCSKLFGLPLEYNGGPGTAGSHWAKRYMNGDYMIGESFGENLISEISLALFEDSGWYKVNWDMANLFLWGKGKGCEFFDREKKCLYAEKVELDLAKLNNTLIDFALGLKGKNLYDVLNAVDSDLSFNFTQIKQDDFFVKNNIFKNSNTKERMSLKVLRKKATEKVKRAANKLKKKSDVSSYKNLTKYNNETYTKNNVTNNTDNNDRSGEDSVIKTVMKIFENHTPMENKSNSKKFILQYKTNFKDEFCTEFNMPVCSTSHLFRGSCSVEDPYEPIEKHEMLFMNTRISGSEKLTDRCPTAIERRYNQASYGGSCRYGEKFPDTKSFEKICPECACFMSNLRETEKKNQIKKSFRKNDNSDKTNKNDKTIYGYKQNNKLNAKIESDSISKAENFLKENKDDVNNYVKINTFYKNPNNQIHYTFLEKNNFEKTPNEIKNKENKDKENKADLDDEDENNGDYQEEYEIIKLNPSLKPEDLVASCFEFKCEKGDLYVLLNDSKFKCEEEGTITKIPGYDGGVRCPSKRILCDEKYLCKFGCVERFNNKIGWENFEEEK